MKKLLLLLNICYVSAFAQAPQLLKDILLGNPIWTGGTSGAISIGPIGLKKYNNNFYFAAPDTTIQSGSFLIEKEYNLWKSDGTAAGTSKVKDLNTNGNDEILISNFANGKQENIFFTYDNKMFFSATDGTTLFIGGKQESQLCTTEGTTTGTSLFKNLRTGFSCSDISYSPQSYTAINEKMLFKTVTYCLPDPSYRYWEYDSIAKTTKKLGEDYVYAIFGGDYRWLHSVFTPLELNSKYILFPQPDRIVFPNANQTISNSSPCLATFNKQLNMLEKIKDSVEVVSVIGNIGTTKVIIALVPYITGNNFSVSLYALDKNTLQITPYYSFTSHVANYSNINATNINSIGIFNNKQYFMLQSPLPAERGLWVTDGTTTGTFQVKSIQHDDMIPQFKIMNNEIYFSSSNYWNSLDTLWKTDGTNAGTKFIAEFYGRSLKISNSALFDNKLYFSAANNANSGLNEELWETDGTISGTKMYYDLLPGNQGSIPEDLLVFNNKLFFSAYTTATGREIFYIESINSTIAENSNNNLKVNLFPNPSTNFVTIEIDTDNSLNGNLKIINTIGQIVHASNIYSSKINVDVSSLNSGIYNVIIENDNYSISKKLQIIK